MVILIFASLKTDGEMFSSLHGPQSPALGELRGDSALPLVLGLAAEQPHRRARVDPCVLTVCSLAAFVFARMGFRGKGVVFTFLTLGLMFPITVAIMPVYLVVRQMN